MERIQGRMRVCDMFRIHFGRFLEKRVNKAPPFVGVIKQYEYTVCQSGRE
jgi:hypothetical protein